MPPTDKFVALRRFDEEAALKSVLEGTATETGEQFLKALVKNLALALRTTGAWVTEYEPERRRLRALAFWLDGKFVDGYQVDIAGTPCEKVIESGQTLHIADNLLGLYPDDPEVLQTGAMSYLGSPLRDLDGKVLGHIAVIDKRAMPQEPRGQTLFRIFAARAAAELQRLRAEAGVREREEKLGRLVNSAMDAIVEFDEKLNVTQLNPAAEKIFGCQAAAAIGKGFAKYLDEASRAKLTALTKELDERPEGKRYLWIPGGLTARHDDGSGFPAEATLARHDMQRQRLYMLILRDVNERLEAEQRIRTLEEEADYLRSEIEALGHFGEIVGQSAPLRKALRDVEQVAVADTTVLIQGETGTGKELFARAIHDRSRRKERALIKVNCAAIPSTLIESEFFGHERGAFTGATGKRDGRFTLADRGTIFLDEVGELPLDLQGKLLRVLQEGEFEPVGSSRTRKVDVRVIAATNRDLLEMVRAGGFREDLYYRLNVFPIRVPPLRERGDDVGLLAEVFVRNFAQSMGRTFAPLAPGDIQRLRAYHWPGNVRELENVIERACIISQNGRLDLLRALPEAQARNGTVRAAEPSAPDRIWTAQELESLERENIGRALEACGGRVSGDHGAARLLGINPSTLASRIKALGIGRSQKD